MKRLLLIISKLFAMNTNAQQTNYPFKTKIPFGWLIIKRTLAVENVKTCFTHDVKFTGLLKKFLGNTLGKNYRAIWPGVLTEIKQIAESK